MEDSSGHGPWSGATTVTYEDLLHGQLLDTLRGRILIPDSHFSLRALPLPRRDGGICMPGAYLHVMVSCSGRDRGSSAVLRFRQSGITPRDAG